MFRVNMEDYTYGRVSSVNLIILTENLPTAAYVIAGEILGIYSGLILFLMN